MGNGITLTAKDIVERLNLTKDRRDVVVEGSLSSQQVEDINTLFLQCGFGLWAAYDVVTSEKCQEANTAELLEGFHKDYKFNALFLSKLFDKFTFKELEVLDIQLRSCSGDRKEVAQQFMESPQARQLLSADDQEIRGHRSSMRVTHSSKLGVLALAGGRKTFEKGEADLDLLDVEDEESLFQSEEDRAAAKKRELEILKLKQELIAVGVQKDFIEQVVSGSDVVKVSDLVALRKCIETYGVSTDTPKHVEEWIELRISDRCYDLSGEELFVLVMNSDVNNLFYDLTTAFPGMNEKAVYNRLIDLWSEFPGLCVASKWVMDDWGKLKKDEVNEEVSGTYSEEEVVVYDNSKFEPFIEEAIKYLKLYALSKELEGIFVSKAMEDIYSDLSGFESLYPGFLVYLDEVLVSYRGAEEKLSDDRYDIIIGDALLKHPVAGVKLRDSEDVVVVEQEEADKERNVGVVVRDARQETNHVDKSVEAGLQDSPVKVGRQQTTVDVQGIVKGWGKLAKQDEPVFSVVQHAGCGAERMRELMSKFGTRD